MRLYTYRLSILQSETLINQLILYLLDDPPSYHLQEAVHVSKDPKLI